MVFEDNWIVEFLIHMEVLASYFWCFSVYDSVCVWANEDGGGKEARTEGRSKGENDTHVISMEILRIEGTAGFSAIC